ncbi:MAG: U32 family peptidase [Clostridiales bacterium]|jgi:putative protease|nr:U32 family peptidase [Clostridiales bacterium]
MIKKPELVAPAGDFERLRAAFMFGATSCYLGGSEFSLRAHAKNFELENIKQAADFAHTMRGKVYVAVNVFAHNNEFERLYNYIIDLRQAGVDALIASDPGVINLIHEVLPDMDIHISTQANTHNYRAVSFWGKLGIKRVILARELSINEISEIHQREPSVELETFVHGAMCAAYSGRCLLSLYMTGRSANRGECAHPCRYGYSLLEETRPGEYFPVEEDGRGTYIMNSKDLCLVQRLPELINAGVAAFKIEGRMKSMAYVAAVTRVYRDAIDDYFYDPELYRSNLPSYISELQKTSRREFTAGFFDGKLSADSISYDNDGAAPPEGSVARSDFCAVVKSYDKSTGCAIIEQRGKFSVGETLEFLTSSRSDFKQVIAGLSTMDGERVLHAPHPKQLLRLEVEYPVRELDILRR